MKFLKKFFYPRWYDTSIRGNLRVMLGEDYASGDIHIVLKFQRREKYYQWKTIAVFYSCEMTQVRQLLSDCERTLKPVE